MSSNAKGIGVGKEAGKVISWLVIGMAIGFLILCIAEPKLWKDNATGSKQKKEQNVEVFYGESESNSVDEYEIKDEQDQEKNSELTERMSNEDNGVDEQRKIKCGDNESNGGATTTDIVKHSNSGNNIRDDNDGSDEKNSNEIEHWYSFSVIMPVNIAINICFAAFLIIQKLQKVPQEKWNPFCLLELEYGLKRSFIMPSLFFWAYS